MDNIINQLVEKLNEIRFLETNVSQNDDELIELQEEIKNLEKELKSIELKKEYLKKIDEIKDNVKKIDLKNKINLKNEVFLEIQKNLKLQEKNKENENQIKNKRLKKEFREWLLEIEDRIERKLICLKISEFQELITEINEVKNAPKIISEIKDLDEEKRKDIFYSILFRNFRKKEIKNDGLILFEDEFNKIENNTDLKIDNSDLEELGNYFSEIYFENLKIILNKVQENRLLQDEIVIKQKEMDEIVDSAEDPIPMCNKIENEIYIIASEIEDNNLKLQELKNRLDELKAPLFEGIQEIIKEKLERKEIVIYPKELGENTKYFVAKI